MIVYQLSASGPMRDVEGSNKIASRKVYRTREAAELAMPAFRVACTTDPPGRVSLTTLESVRMMAIIELELEET